MKIRPRLQPSHLANAITVLATVMAIAVGGRWLYETRRGGVGYTESVWIADWQEFASTGHRSGPIDAQVTVVEFLDFTCEFCQEAALALKALRDRYPDELAVVSRHALSSHPNALATAEASECAASLGRFHSFYDVLMAQMGDLAVISHNDWVAWAEASGVEDLAAFVACVATTSEFPAIRRDTVAASKLGVHVTPTLLVNGLLFHGYPGFDRLHEAVRQEIERIDSEVPTVSHDTRRQPEAWQIEKVWELTGATAEFLDSDWLARTFVAVDSTGTVYLMNRTAKRIYLVSNRGLLVDSLGGPGEGPGELARPAAIDVTPNGVLTVFDRTGSLIRWQVPERELLSHIRMADYFAFGNRHFRALPEGFMATERHWLRREGTTDVYRPYVTRWTADEGAERIDSGSAVLYRALESPECIEGVVFPQLFQPTLPWDLRGDVFAIASTSSYMIDVFQDHKLLTRIQKQEVGPRRVTKGMLEREEDTGLVWGRNQDCFVSSAQLIDGKGHAEYLQAVVDVRLAPSGELWVLRGRVKDEPAMIDVYSKDGSWVGTLPPGSPFPAAFLPTGELLVIGADEFGRTLALYRLSSRPDTTTTGRSLAVRSTSGAPIALTASGNALVMPGGNRDTPGS
ncbi:MAG: thioredoxin domain-containing protein [Gemmatimonadota bacterium]|nr:thioredoxin domain-containing protein [Gemmatimonadota bacterium]